MDFFFFKSKTIPLRNNAILKCVENIITDVQLKNQVNKNCTALIMCLKLIFLFCVCKNVILVKNVFFLIKLFVIYMYIIIYIFLKVDNIILGELSPYYDFDSFYKISVTCINIAKYNFVS